MLEIQNNILMKSEIFASSREMYQAYVATVMCQSEFGPSYEPGRHGTHAEKLRFYTNAVYGAYAYTHDAVNGGTWVAEIIAPAPPRLLVIARRICKTFFWEKSVLRQMAGLDALSKTFGALS